MCCASEYLHGQQREALTGASASVTSALRSADDGSSVQDITSSLPIPRDRSGAFELSLT